MKKKIEDCFHSGEEQPEGACKFCGSTIWWRRPDGGWCCVVCHPDPRTRAPAKEKRE